MVTKAQDAKAKAKGKAKARKLDITQLLVLGAWEKTFSTGKTGFFGQVRDVQTGQRYQVIGAVAIEG